MAHEKRQYEAPEDDVSQLDLQNPDMIVEVDETPVDTSPKDVDIQATADGGAIVDLGGGGSGNAPAVDPADFRANLAETLGEESVEGIAADLLEAVEQDIASRKDWEDIITDGMDLLGLKLEETDDPFPGATTVAHPVLAEAVIKYQAKARAQILPAKGPAKTKIMGAKNPETVKAGFRVSSYLNHQLTDLMDEYVPDRDRMLLYQAFMGMAFTKFFFDPLKGRPCSKFIKPLDLIVNYHASSLKSAERVAERFEISHNDYLKSVAAGLYRDVDIEDTQNDESASDITDKEDKLGGRTRPSGDHDDVHTFFEFHVNIDIEGDFDDTPFALPYIVTVDEQSEQVLSIYRNWEEGDTLFQKLNWYVDWPFIPGFGFYSFGYVHIIGSLAKASTSSLRQLLDAGAFANLPAGFKAHGLRVVGDSGPISPGEWREVNAPGADLSKALIPLPYKEPSPTLFKLLEFTVAAAQRFADQTDQVVSEATNYGPVGTTIALLEAGGKLFSAIHERLFVSQKNELTILVRLNKEYLQAYPYKPRGGEPGIAPQDFNMVEIIPATDPRSPTEAHRLAKANAIWSVASQSPQLHQMRNVAVELYTALGVDNPDDILTPPPPQAQPMDPISENLAALENMPITSVDWQDHQSHILVHTNFLKDEKNSQNPTLVATMMAHIQKHLALEYKVAMAREMGQALPPLEELNKLPPEQQNALAQAAAEASRKVLSEVREVEEEQDPVLEMQERDQAISLAKIAQQDKDSQLDAEVKVLDIQTDAQIAREKIESQENIATLQALCDRCGQEEKKCECSKGGK